MSLPQLFTQEMEQLIATHKPTRLVIAYSGGVDSTVLLDLTHQYAIQHPLPVVALHINHGLSVNAISWEQHCKKQAVLFGCEFVASQVEVLPDGKGLEEAARLARYQVFGQFLETTDLLLLGHHLQDQLETVLFRLCRGSGVTGLGGIPSSRVIGKSQLARPLLTCTKHELLAYAEQRQLSWIEDESNQRLDFSRNFLRHEILPALTEHWPQLPRQLMGSVEHCQDATSILRDMAVLDWQTTQVRHNDAWAKALPVTPLNCHQLLELSSPRRHNLIRYWLKQLDVNITRPLLIEVEESLLIAADDAMPAIQVGRGPVAGVLTRFQSNLVWLPFHLATWQQPDLSASWEWAINNSLYLTGNGQLNWQQQQEGVSAAKIAKKALTIAYREQLAACKFRVPRRRGSKTLKRWFQEYKVPPWLRERWPLLLIDGELVAIPGLLINKAFASNPEGVNDIAEPGIAFQWTLPSGDG